MKSYVLPGINAAQRQELTQSGVPFNNWAGGILITGPQTLAEALRVLNATAEEVRTEYENFYEVRLTYNGNADVVVADEEHYFGETFARDGNGHMYDDEEDDAPVQPARPWRIDDEFEVDRRYRTIYTLDGPVRVPRVDNREERTEVQPEQTTPADPRAASRQNYINACAARFNEVRQQARETGLPTIARVQTVGAQFVEATRNAAFAGTTESPESLRQRFQSELEKIHALAKVHDVRVTPGSVMVYTDELVATLENGEQRKIGRFMIWIRMSGKDAGVYWFNSSRRVDGARNAMNAPYVYADGKPSSDEIVASMLEMIGRCELASLVDVAIQYVETVDPANPLSVYVENWPQVKKRPAENEDAKL